jgi:hypothetical protein
MKPYLSTSATPARLLHHQTQPAIPSARSLKSMRGRGWYIGLIFASLLMISCSSGGTTAEAPGACAAAEGERGVGRYEPSPPGDLLQRAGFKDTTGLELLGADEECGLDARVRVALRGDPAAIDAALTAADFNAPPAPGMSVFQPPLDAVDLEGLREIVSSEQQSWENDSGEQLVRMYVRGGTGANHQEVLHIWAFTT